MQTCPPPRSSHWSAGLLAIGPLLLLLFSATLFAAPGRLQLRVLPAQLFWQIRSQHAILSLDLALHNEQDIPIKLRFAQLYASRKGTTTQIQTLPRQQLIAHATTWDTSQRRWVQLRRTQLPPRARALLSLPILSASRDALPDTLLLRLYFQQRSKTLQRTLTLRPTRLSLPRLRFPVKGRWWIASGSQPSAPHRKPHAPTDSLLVPQRFALDLIRVAPDNRVHKGAPHNNESYLSFAQQVLAPAKGTVVTVEKGHKDQRPGQPDRKNPLGNYLILKHAPKRFFLLAHLKQGSIQVEKGEQVKRGQWIARVGNSGDGAAPHLHIQLLDGPTPEQSTPLPLLFWGLSLLTPSRTPFCPHAGQIVLSL